MSEGEGGFKVGFLGLGYSGGKEKQKGEGLGRLPLIACLENVVDVAHLVVHRRLLGVVLPLSVDDEFVLVDSGGQELHHRVVFP